MESVVYAISPLVTSSSNLSVTSHEQSFAFVDDVASLAPALPTNDLRTPLVQNYGFDINYAKSPQTTTVSSSTNSFQISSDASRNSNFNSATVALSNGNNVPTSESISVDSTTENSNRLPNVLTFNLPIQSHQSNVQISTPNSVQQVVQEPAGAQQQQQQYNIAASSCGAKVIILSSSTTPTTMSQEMTVQQHLSQQHQQQKQQQQQLIHSSQNQQPPPSRARDSLPLEYLYFKSIFSDSFGVFAAQAIATETMLGPIEGTLAKYNDAVKIDSLNRIARENIHSLTIFFSETYLLSQESADNSNWTRFVRPAASVEEQNLELFESLNNNELKFFFIAIRPIRENEELRVWYSKEICSRFKIDTIEQRSQSINTFIKVPTKQNNLIGNDSSSGHKLRNKIAKVAAASSSSLSSTECVHQCTDSNETSSGKNISVSGLDLAIVDHRCEHCSKTFPRSSNLQRHIAAMHSGNVAKLFKCPICYQEFNHVYNRNRHMKNKHNLATTSDAPQMLASPILIPIKDQASLNSEMLTNHVVIVSSAPTSNTKIVKKDFISQQKQQSQQQQQQSTLFSIDRIKIEKADSESVVIPSIKTTQASQPEPKPTPDSSSSSTSVLGKILSEAGSTTGVFGVKSSVTEFKSYRCTVCYKRFSTSDRLNKHAMVHDESAKKLQCNVCRRKFLTASALSCHTKTHSYSELDPRTYDCPLCDQVFNNIQARRDHAIVHIKQETGLYHCPKCSKTFSDFTPIRKHMRSFHSNEEFPCSQCDKIFPRQDKLRLHMLCHTDHCEFKCEHCDKQFKRKDKLKEHKIRMHAPDRNERIAAKIAARMQRVKPSRVKKAVAKPSQPDYENYSFKCHICRLGFKRRGMLVNHLAKRHPDVPYDTVPELRMPIVKTSKDYFCQYCEKIYKSSSKRKAHILKNHPGESLPPSNRSKNLPSDHPNPTYSATVGSIAIEPHFCPWCHKQYASKAKLMQHQRKKHAEQLSANNSSPMFAHHSQASQINESEQITQTNKQEKEQEQQSQAQQQSQTQNLSQHLSQQQLQPQHIILVSNFTDSSVTSSSPLKRTADGSIINGTTTIPISTTFELSEAHTDNSTNYIVDGNTADLFDQNLNYIKEEFILDEIDLLKDTTGGTGSLTSDAPGSLSDEDHFMTDYSSHFDVKNIINYDHTSGPFMTTTTHHGHHEASLDFLFSEINSTDSSNGNPMLASSIGGSSLAILVPSEPRTSFTDFSDIMSSMSTEYSNQTPGTGSTESDGLLIHDSGWNAVCEDIASMI